MKKSIKAQINDLNGQVHKYTLNYSHEEGLKLVMAYRNILRQVYEFDHVSGEDVENLSDLALYWYSHGLNVESPAWNKPAPTPRDGRKALTSEESESHRISAISKYLAKTVNQ